MREQMPSSHHVLLSLFFFMGLELTFALQRFVILFLLVLFGLIAVGVLFVRKEENQDFHPTQAILPVLAAMGLTAFALFLPVTPLLHLYFLAATLALYFLLRFGARQAYPTWNWGLSSLTFFVTMAAVLGWHFHLAQSLLATLLLTWATAFFIGWQATRRIPGAQPEALLLALSLAFVLTEIVWVLQFTPLHFLVQAGVGLIAYYIMFQLLARSFEVRLTRAVMVEYTLMGVLALGILLLTARWT